MTALQVIIKEAKAIRKKSPKIEWKKAVAQASAIYASKHKGKSPVGKKKTVKKAAKKKAVGKYVKTVRKGKITDVIYKRKKIGAVKKATTMHKDTKSHNVNIRVMSGIGATKISFEKLQKAISNANEYKNIINNINKELINKKGFPTYIIKDLKDTKKTFQSMLKEEKTHIAELKKYIK